MTSAEKPGPVASLAAVSHRYGKVTALSDVTLRIPMGRMVGLIGPDGVGKSTLMGLIAGAKKLQTGGIETLGGNMSSARVRTEMGRRIAFMPQGLGKNLYHDLSIRENSRILRQALRPEPGGTRRTDRTADPRHWPCAVSRPPGGQALGWHEAEAGTLCRADP